MVNISLNPVKGFRDLYPQDKAVQEFVFGKLKAVANLLGYQPYDGPILEPIDIYLNKTSKELIDRQTFQIKDKKEQILVMRPEMTPSLARMIAKKANELTFPLRLFNLGLRYRYETPQKGREREFYQADFDILGSSSLIADAEIINTAVQIFLSLGAKKEDFVIYLNSRSVLEKYLIDFGYKKEEIKPLFKAIDLQDEISNEEFIKVILAINNDQNKAQKLVTFLNIGRVEKSDYFTKLMSLLQEYKIDQYCQINYNITRGLDYYTGLVFEVKEQGGMKRSLLGGGRYDNLISSYIENLKIPGVGFATSDVVLLEFLKDKNLLLTSLTSPTKVLITVFNEQLLPDSLKLLNELRNNNIPSVIYPEVDKKLDKQLKYADRVGIPYVVIIGPEEKEKGIIKLKNMKSGEQNNSKSEQLVELLNK